MRSRDEAREWLDEAGIVLTDVAPTPPQGADQLQELGIEGFDDSPPATRPDESSPKYLFSILIERVLIAYRRLSASISSHIRLPVVPPWKKRPIPPAPIAKNKTI